MRGDCRYLDAKEVSTIYEMASNALLGLKAIFDAFWLHIDLYEEAPG
jgi:hypothetical protein